MNFKILAVLLLGIISRATVVLSADVEREEVAKKVASVLNTQILEALNRGFATCRTNLSIDGLVQSYRDEIIIDQSFGIAFYLLDKLTEHCKRSLTTALVLSEFSTSAIEELYSNFTSREYILYHVEALNAIKELMASKEIGRIDDGSLSAEQADLVDALGGIPGAQQTSDAKNGSRYIATKIADPRDARKISEIVRSKPYQFAVGTWQKSFSTVAPE